MKISETIRRLYKKITDIRGVLDVKTDRGWEPVEYVMRTPAQQVYEIATENGLKLNCSADHIVIDGEGNEVLAKDSLNREIKTDKGVSRVVSAGPTGKVDELYDVSLGGGRHVYYANGMLSHNCVICDEFSFVPNNIANKVFESIYPVISSSKKSKFIIVSTPNGADPNNLYYTLWQQANQKTAEKNKEGWKPFRIDWWDVPGRDQKWKDMTLASIGARRFAQEFGNEFLSNSTSRKLIDDETIEKFRMKLSEYDAVGFRPMTQKILSENQKRLFEFQMWHEFDKGRTYMASGDVAEGVGGDSSVLYVWDVTDLKNVRMCAKFSSNRASTTEFAYVCSKILAAYGDPFLFVERNGLSSGAIDALRLTYGYQNVAAESRNGEFGIYSHAAVKIKACLWAREMLTTDGFGFTVYDKDLVDEMGTFVKRDGKSDKTTYAAVSPAHDDHVMSFVWACWALSKDVVEKYFIVAKSFKSVFDQFHPEMLVPLQAYSPDVLKRISDDPVFADFKQFKETQAGRSAELQKMFEAEDQQDLFKYAEEDPYFGNDGSAEWGSPWSGARIQQGDGLGEGISPNNRMPVFFI